MIFLPADEHLPGNALIDVKINMPGDFRQAAGVAEDIINVSIYPFQISGYISPSISSLQASCILQKPGSLLK